MMKFFFVLHGGLKHSGHKAKGLGEKNVEKKALKSLLDVLNFSKAIIKYVVKYAPPPGEVPD